MKKICMLICFAFVTCIGLHPNFISVAASEDTTPPVTFTYEQALQLALGNMINIEDINIEIRETQDVLSELRDELARFQSGNWAQERANELHELLWGIEMQLGSSHAWQGEMSAITEESLHLLLLSIANIHEEGADELLLESLQSTIMGILFNQNIGSNIATMEMQREIIWRELNALHEGTLLRELTEDVQLNISDLNRYVQALRLHQEQAKLARENTLRTAIVTLIELEAAISISKQKIILDNEDLRRLSLRHELGRASINAVQTAQLNIQIAEMELEELFRRQRTAMRNLNHLLGQPLTQYTVVTITPYFPEPPEDMQRFINTVIQTTPTTRELNLEVVRTREARRAYTGNDRDKRALLREAYEHAETTMEVTMRLRFSELESLISRAEALYLELTQAETRLQVALRNLELGRITQHEVNQALFSIYVIEQDVEAVLKQKWRLTFLIDNPSILV